MKNKTVLIVEDEASLNTAYNKKLSQFFTLKSCKTCQEGFNLALKEKPDLILLDIMLPGGENGFDLLKKLKSNDNTSHIPVIVATNLTREEEATSLDLGAVEFVVKSELDLDQLVNLINRHI